MRRIYSVFLITLFIIMFLSAGVTGQGETPLDDMRLNLGDSNDFFVRVYNPLADKDILNVEFRGDALSLIDLELLDSYDDVTDLENCDFNSESLCCDQNLECRLELDPGEERQVSYRATSTMSGDITGIQQGQAELISEAVSEKTHLDDHDTVTVIVDPVAHDEGIVGSTGLTAPFLVLLFLAGTTFYMFYKD